MRRDELKQPLHKRSLGQRLWQQRPSPLATAFAVLCLSYAGGTIWLMRQPLPLAGEPQVAQAIPALEKIESAKPEPQVAADTSPGVESVDDQTNIVTGSVVPITNAAGQTITKLNKYVTVISVARPSLIKAPVADITEDGKDGPLPKISSNGKKPSDVYGRSASMNALHSDTPKVVIILGGMGLNEKLTRDAISSLPSEVTFAFAPYGNDLQDQVDKAREQGHEVLLQLPLEPVGYPANNPGPKTLLADGDPAANHDSLYWHMSRFSGYAGVINFMGGRFLTAPNAIKPLLTELKKRGLNFIEDGSLPLTSTDQVASGIQVPIRHGNGVIDQNPDAQSIKAALTALEDQARNGEIAIGTGTGLQVTIDAVKDWARDAQSRGVIIVPATAAFKGRTG